MNRLHPNIQSIFERLGRLLLALFCFAAFSWAVFFTALQTKTARPVALDISQRATELWESVLSSIGQFPVTAAGESGNASAALGMSEAVQTVVSATTEAVSQDAAANESAVAPESQAAIIAYNTVETIDLVSADKSTITRTFTGVLTPAQSSNLGFKRVDRIKKMLVDQGDIVNSGDTLAVLDTRSLLAEKGVLLAELRAAKAKLAELEAGPRQQTIDAAQAKLQELQSLVELANITSDRQGRLIAESVGSQQQFDNARLQRAAAESRYRSQQQVVRELEAGTRKEQLEAQTAVIEKLQAGIASLDITIEESTLKAPYDAIVSKRMADKGMIVAPGTTILRLVQQDSPEAWIGVPTNVASRLESGNTFRLTLGNETMDAKLKAILPELDAATRTQTAIFVVEPGSESPSFGQVARLEWQQQEKLAGYWLPMSALTNGVRGLWSVFVVEPNGDQTDTFILRRRDVEVLRIETDRVLLRGTLETGERIVSGGVQKLVAGQIVKRVSN